MTYSIWTAGSSGLVPGDEEAAKICSKLKIGQQVKVEVTRVRSPEQLRMYWALITKAWENQEAYATKEDLSAAALCAVGHCYRVERAGVVIERAKSIAFGNLPQAEFTQIFDAVADLLSRTLGVTPDTLRGEAADTSLPTYITEGNIAP